MPYDHLVTTTIVFKKGALIVPACDACPHHHKALFFDEDPIFSFGILLLSFLFE